MTVETTESLLPPGPADRRPAIWPWLVMPLVTLLLFYSLDRLQRDRNGAEDSAPASAPQAAADTASESETR